jgi:predicted RNA-binding Zn ribbon-like protein
VNTTVSLPPDLPADAPVPGLDSAIDFVNTTGISRGRPFEDFKRAGDAVHWLHAEGYLDHAAAIAEFQRLTADEARGTSALLRLRAVRGGLREVIDAIDEERAPHPDAIAAVNDALGLPERAAMRVDGNRVLVETRRDGEPFDQALAEIARSIADELRAGRPERFRICQNDTCRWAFYDKSRPGTRRWCEMSSCGNRMKAARHRARQKATESAETAATD